MSTSKALKSAKKTLVQSGENTGTAQRKRIKPPAPVTPPPAAISPIVPPAAPAKRQPKAAPAQSAGAKKAVAVSKPSPGGQSVTQTKPSQPKRTRAETPVIPAAIAKVVASPAKKKRVKAPSAVQVQETPAAADASQEPMATNLASVARAPIPEPELWEKDSPVMRRISVLRTRNAQLSEQVHRLKKPI